MKRIIVLQHTVSDTQQTITAAFWHAITSGAAPVTNNSAWGGASGTENTAIQNGSVLEEVHAFEFPVGVAVTTIKDVLLNAWQNRNTQLNGVGPNIYTGVFDDSATGWSA